MLRDYQYTLNTNFSVNVRKKLHEYKSNKKSLYAQDPSENEKRISKDHYYFFFFGGGGWSLTQKKGQIELQKKQLSWP